MTFGEKLFTSWIQLRFYARLAPNMPGFLPSGSWSASRLVEERARKAGRDPGIAFEDRRYTWSEVNDETNRWANFFRARGIGAGDTVALLLDNRPEYLFALSGLGRIHAVAALINTNISGKGLVHALEISNACACIVGSEHSAKLKEVLGELAGLPEEMVFEQAFDPDAALVFASAAEAVGACNTVRPEGIGLPRGDQPMCFIYTSGTTGLPKAAIIKNSRWFTAASLFGLGLLNLKPGDINYVTLPFYHSNAMFAGWGAALTTGAGIAVRRKFSASNFWDDIRQYEATCFIYIGELLRYLLNQPEKAGDRNHAIRVITGNGLRPDIWEKFRDRFGIEEIREFYGATEGNAPVVNLENKPGMVGRLGNGQRVVKCDLASGNILRNADGFCEEVAEGETGLLIAKITAISPFDGYADKTATATKILPDVFATGDRHFNTGDLLVLHENAWLSFADRVGDTFRWKGENVSTNEVAETLNEAPGVLESNVYGVTVPGADGRAGMASLNCSESFSLPEFATFVMEKLPGYQRPYFLRIQRDMRITGTFKHQKVDYRKEGYDPSLVEDPLYLLEGDHYQTIDLSLFRAIRTGEKLLR
jgi:fatty-acyl-CoA synthase